MSTDDITYKPHIFSEDKNEAITNNLLSDINFSSGEEEYDRRKSLRTFTLNDILKDEFDIFDRSVNKDDLKNFTKDKYKSVQLTQDNLKELDYLMRKGNNKREWVNHDALLKIEESSSNIEKENDNKKDNIIDFINLETNNYENINLKTELEQRNPKNIKKVMKNNGKIYMNVQSDFSNNVNLNNTEMKKIGKRNSNIDNISKKYLEKNDKIETQYGKNNDQTKKRPKKSSSISITIDRISMKGKDNISKYLNKRSSIIKNNINNTNLEKDDDKDNCNLKKEENGIIRDNNIDHMVKINNTKSGSVEKTDVDFLIQTPLSKNSLTLSANPTHDVKNLNNKKKFNTNVNEIEREDLNLSSTIKKNYDKPHQKKSSDNIQINSFKNKNQKRQILNSTNYNTNIVKKSEKPNIRSLINKTSTFSFSEKSSTLVGTKTKKDESSFNPDLFSLSKDGTKTTRAENASSSLIKFNTSKHFNKASSLPKNPSPLIEIKEYRNELTISVEAKQAKNKKINVEEFYSKKMDYLEKRKKKIEEMTESFRKKEMNSLLACPSICKTSKKIAEKNTNDFYTRQTTFSNKIESKIKEKIDEQNKKETEMMEKFQQKYKGKKVDMNHKYESLLNWQKLKIEVIKEKQKNEYETQIKSCTFKPEIDVNSKKITGIKRSCENTGVTQDTVSRLYKEDTIKRKHKNEILMNIYTPSFSPMVIKNNKITLKKNNHCLNDNYVNNSFNNHLNNTTCNTISGLPTANGNFGNANASGVKDYYKYRNQHLYSTINSKSSNNGNKNIYTFNDTVYEHINNNMRKFKSQNRYLNSRENSATKASNYNDFVSNKNVKDNNIMNSSFHSEKNGDGKVYYKSFFTEAADNSRDLGNQLKERFQNVFKKYNFN